jgi:hypothetical protein
MDTDQTPARLEGPPRVLLIDLDNCPQQLDQLPDNLAGFSRIVVCYGSQEPKLPLSLVTALAEPVLGGQLEIVGMEKKGKNAADFGLCFHAGRLMVEMPPGTEFILLSDDRDLDHAVHLLRTHQRSARRVSSKQERRARIVDSDEVETAARDYAAHLLQNPMSRPGSRKTLLNSIKSYIRNHYAVTPQSVLDWLRKEGEVEVTDSGKVRYFDELFEEAETGLSMEMEDEGIPF